MRRFGAEPAIDFQTARLADLGGVGDPQVLAIAAHEGRLLVTHDQTTMPRHFAEFVTEHASSGVLIAPQHLSVADVAEELLLVWAATEADEWINRICFLPF